MPDYMLNHIHQECADVQASADWYIKLFDATADDPFERGGANWIRVHIGSLTVTLTDRECVDTELARLKGYDHLGISTSDFDETMQRVEELGVEVWQGPMDAGGFRIVFINGPDNVKIELMEQN